MLALDARTLLIVGFFSYTLVGCLTLMAAILGQRNQALSWCAMACLFGGLAYLVGLQHGEHYWNEVSIWLSNIGLIMTYGCLWTSFRVFSGKPPVWSCLCAGGVIWACLCLWPAFLASVYFRIAMFSLLAIGYAVLCYRAVLPNLRDRRWLTLFLLAVLVLHAVFYLVRMVPWPTSGATWLARPDFSLTVFENILVITSLAYGLLIMVNDRTMQRYRGALRARRDLLGHISHDLRSPLAAIVDSARLWRGGDTRRDYPRLIERHADRQMELIDELLEFSGTDLSAAAIEPVPGYLFDALDEAAETTELATERHGNRLHRHFAADLPAVVRADFRSLRRVLTNLLGNADKYTRDGDIHFIVERLRADEPDRVRLRFVVDDNGPGMVPEERERLLQPFIRGDNADRIEGNGLGLAIVTALLGHMGSHLEVDDSPLGGSRFHFELALPLASESELEPGLADDGTVDVDGSGRTILVVDDDRRQREMVCDLLHSYDFDTLTAADGRTALGLLRDQPVDLIVTDQYMPVVDGWRLLEHVRRHHAALSVLLCSALPPLRPPNVDRTSCFDAVLSKPVDGAILLQRIALLLDEPARTGTTERL